QVIATPRCGACYHKKRRKRLASLNNAAGIGNSLRINLVANPHPETFRIIQEVLVTLIGKFDLESDGVEPLVPYNPVQCNLQTIDARVRVRLGYLHVLEYFRRAYF